ncbi:MAG: GntP family permease, partial [Thermoplasmata archaeon]
MLEGPMLLVILAIAVAWIIFATAKLNLNAFLALLVAAFFAGIAARMPLPDVVNNITSGFG